MDLHLPALVGGERARLREDVFRNRQLSDVVQQRRRFDRLRVELGELEASSQHRGVVAHPIEMAGAGAVPGLNRARENLCALAVQLRRLDDATLLVGNARAVDAVRPVGQYEGHECERRLPVSRIVTARRPGLRSGRRRQLVMLQRKLSPDAEDGRRRQPECRRDREQLTRKW